MYGYSVTITIIAAIAIFAFIVLFFHGDYLTKILTKLGFKEKTAKLNYAVVAWRTCLEQLDYKADIAFLGDSITQCGQFQNCFKTKRIVNLGYGGDTIDGITKRVEMVKAVLPDKIFLMCGINSLNNNNLRICLNRYSFLLKSLSEALPDVEIYVQSVLPVLDGRKLLCSNKTIKNFNAELEKMSKKYNAIYIDLFSLFIEAEKPRADLYRDNVHIAEAGYKVWANAISKYID